MLKWFRKTPTLVFIGSYNVKRMDVKFLRELENDCNVRFMVVVDIGGIRTLEESGCLNEN
jgi:hypothetical protein